MSCHDIIGDIIEGIGILLTLQFEEFIPIS